jgi:type VI secretion system secreted protein VgrG
MIHGVLADGDWVRIENELAHYRLTLRPWFWLLDKTSDCRIFHDKTCLDIIRETFARHGFSDFRVAATHDYPVLHYTVQYRESDFNFLSRLMEQHGLYYYFEHSADAHVMVLCDGPASHPDVPALDDVVFVSAKDAEHSMRRQTIQSWKLKRSLRSGRAALQDFNHLTPNAQMLGDAAAAEKYAHADFEVYDYPGPHAKQGDGTIYARVRLEAEQAADKRRHAAGYVVSAFAGAPLKLDWHPRASENGKYLIVGTQLRYGPQYYWAQQDGKDAAYHGDYDLLAFDTPFRTPLTTPKPRIASLQTAIVVGQSGEEIDCDDHGRILVHFHWDRHADKSCRVRVNQVWGSKTWGMQTIPRIGMEVMVAYLEGDPDRPIVVGCVPDPVNNTVPYALPENKTRMVWRSNSHKSQGFNELAFEDKTGGENIHLHAQKDFTHKVLNNLTQRVDNSHATSIGQHASMEVGGNHTQEVGGSQTNVVGATGPASLMALAPVLGLMGQTAGLAGEAAGQAGGLGAIQSLAMGVAGSAAQALLSGGGLAGRSGVVDGGTTRGDAGTALAGAGAQLLQGVGSLFGMGGVQNNIVAQAKTDVVGQMRTETIGTTKVTNVGQTFYTKVGKAVKLEIGERYQIGVGKVIFSSTVKHVIVAEEKIVIAAPGGEIEINKMGIFLRGKIIQMESKVIAHKPGDGGCKASSPYMKE